VYFISSLSKYKENLDCVKKSNPTDPEMAMILIIGLINYLQGVTIKTVQFKKKQELKLGSLYRKYIKLNNF